MENEVGRGRDFYDELRRIQYQSDRVAENPNYDLDLEDNRSFIKEKSIRLLAAIVNYFNCALLYYNARFFGCFPFYSALIDSECS